MKSFSLFCFAALLAFEQGAFAQPNFTTGQAARAVIGQPRFDAQSQNSSDTVVGAASGVAYAADMLFVADDNLIQAVPENNRVLIFKNLSSQVPAPTAQPAYTTSCPVCVGQANVVLGQPDMITTVQNNPATQNNLRQPTAVASDGVHLVVADTNHNRVLIWNSIPTTNNQPADVVVGQPDFFSTSLPGATTPTAKSLRSPQGVWIQGGKLYVADTGYNRVLIYNHIPTANGAAADVALGAPNLTTAPQPTLLDNVGNPNFDANTSATAANLFNPVSVTSDGVHLFVSDLGNNRVLIWNQIPTASGTPADVVVGQPDMTSTAANNAFTGQAAISTVTNVQEKPVLCPDQNGTDYNGNPTYPNYCNATLSFPRFALSDGTRLFISDSGNDRVLVYQQIPTANGATADIVLGQVGGEINQASQATDSLMTPSALAWDGVNLYVADTYNRRVEVFSIGANNIPYSGVRNAASLQIFAVGSVTVGGTATANDTVAITIGNTATNNGTACSSPNQNSSVSSSTTGNANAPEGCGTTYTYTVKSGDTLLDIVNGLVAAINAGSGDPNAFAFADPGAETVVLTAKAEGVNGNNVTYVTSVSTNATETLTAAGATLEHGGDASQLAPGTLVTVEAGNGPLSAKTASADPTATLPTTLGDTQVYMNGIAVPLLFVSPGQINAQIPWEFNNTTSISVYVRSVMSDGTVMVTTPVAVTIITQNPGIFTLPSSSNQQPLPGVLFHGSSSADDAVLIDGTINPGDVATITVGGRSYSYTVQANDTLESVRDALVAQLNQDPQIYAVAGVAFAVNLQIYARVPGPDGNGIPVTATTTNSSGGAQLILTASNQALCCANIAGSPVTPDNPAVPGEILWIYATGLGLPQVTANTQSAIVTGQPYPAGGPETQPPSASFVSSLAGGSTANILSASLLPGTVGIFRVVAQLNSSLPTDYFTQIYIAQQLNISNTVTFPVVAP
ncbi:MAG TPA: hypothetical protein VKV17_08200 [Bryobacteraceae bacterium]|nr:hypothetical protein [Bryobacteraceae bacterium]